MDMAREAIGAMYESGTIPINGRTYSLHPMRHLERRQVFAFFSEVMAEIESGRFGWLSRPEFAAVEAIMWRHLSLDGAIIAQTKDHWETYPDDYLELATLGMAVLSFPFLRGVGGGSASRAAATAVPIRSSKPTFQTP